MATYSDGSAIDEQDAGAGGAPAPSLSPMALGDEALGNDPTLDHVSRVLGHSDSRTTANVYAHYGEELRRDAAERMARALGYSAGPR